MSNKYWTDKTDGIGKIVAKDFNDAFDGLGKDIESGVKGLTSHKAAEVLDHPDGSVTTEKIANGAVTDEKITDRAVTTDKLADEVTSELNKIPIIENNVGELKSDLNELQTEVNGVLVTGKNKFNPSNIYSYYTINASGELESISTNGTVSDFITIPDGASHIVWSYTNTANVTAVLPDAKAIIAFYDSSKTLIDEIIKGGEADIPTEAVYVRVYVSVSYVSRLAYCMLEFSDTLTSYEAYEEYYSDGLIPDVSDLKTRVSALESKTLIEGIVDGSIKKVKIIGDSITQGVGGTGFNPNNSSSTTYYDDIAAEKDAGTWSWDFESGNTYFGDGEVVLVYTAGDKNTYYRKNSGNCYANKLVNYLQTKYGITVENFGTRGLSFHHLFKLSGVCEDGVKRIMAEQIIEDDDDAIICMFGTNDRTDSFSTLKSEIQALVDYVVKTKGKKLVLMASVPARASGETSSSLYMEDVASCICSVAKSNKVEFVSLHKDMTEYLRNTNKTINEVTADSLHPNDTGYDLMYRFALEDLGFGSPIPDATWI